MISKIKNLIIQALIDIKNAKNINSLELVRIQYLGKNGYFTKYFNMIANIDRLKRPEIGIIINEGKFNIEKELIIKKNKLEALIVKKKLIKEKIDISLPGRCVNNGGLHPITYVIKYIENLFSKIGFSIIHGPEIEDIYHNFHALNIPDDHTSFNNSDTFWINKFNLLRTHTSGMQIRIMKTHNLPIRILSFGRVYRRDYDRIHTPMFHQIEGFVVDKGISFANLKGTMYDFLNNFFEKKIEIRFRPSYFPFTEPSAEIDIKKENSDWLEILGCGMIHPSVFNNVKINKEKYSGFAFGMGVERLAMLRYGVKDSRDFFKNDLRFLKQFNL